MDELHGPTPGDDKRSEAERQWDLIDVDHTGKLNPEEQRKLADWLWRSFRPGQEPTPEEVQEEATKMVARHRGEGGLEADGDGWIEREEFLEYVANLLRRRCHKIVSVGGRADAANAHFAAAFFQ